MGGWRITRKGIYRNPPHFRTMGAEEGQLGAVGVDRPLLALGVALGIDLVTIPLVFVLLVVWPIVILAIVPYVGGRIGGRFTSRRNATRFGALAGAIMVTVLVAILFSVLAQLPGENFDPLEPVGLSIVVAGYAVALVFGAIGGRHSAPQD